MVARPSARRLPAMTAPPAPPVAPPPVAAPPAAARRALSAIAWMAVLLIVAVAGAGLILSLDHPPTEEGRPELTARGHALVAPRLEGMDIDIGQLATAGDLIAAAGRDTLTRLRSLDAPRTERALAAGDAYVADGSAIRDRLVAARATLLEGTTLAGLPASDRVRIEALDAAITAADELPGYWNQVVLAAAGPLDLVESMAVHDAAVIAATDSGRAGDWAGALAALGEAAAPLITVRTVREVANSQGADVSTLDDLLDRIEEYDAALTELYASLRESGGDTTVASRAARGTGAGRTGEPARGPDGDGRHRVRPGGSYHHARVAAYRIGAWRAGTRTARRGGAIG